MGRWPTGKCTARLTHIFLNCVTPSIPDFSSLARARAVSCSCARRPPRACASARATPLPARNLEVEEMRVRLHCRQRGRHSSMMGRQRVGVPRDWLALLGAVAISFAPASHSSCSFEPIGCYKDQGTPRTFRFHLDGCPTAAAWGSPEPPTASPAPKCDPKRVSIEYCASECAQWNPWAGSTEFFIGLESGIGVDGARPDYAECLCDDVAHGPEAAQILAEQPATSAIQCPAKCPGAEPGGVDHCGGAPGTWALNVYKVNCSAAWGLAFLVTLGVGCAFYVAGGVVWSVRVHGARPELLAHPHFVHWGQVAGLVQDGIKFASAQLKKQSAGLHAPLAASATSDSAASVGTERTGDVPPPTVASDDSSDGADELVE